MQQAPPTPGKAIAINQQIRPTRPSRDLRLTLPSRDTALSLRLQLCIAALLFLAVLITRLPTFFRSVMDWDESLYFLIAEQWRAGHLPYTAIWDNKPIGIYGVFALFQTGFGDTVISIRIASVVFISATAFAIFKIAWYIPVSPANPVSRRFRATCALFASIAYVVCSLTNDGLAANTEIFMACFTALAVLSALSRSGFLAGFMAGLLFGLAFMTKYVAVFELPAFAFALLALQPRPNLKTAIKAGLAAAAGAALPLLLTMLLYSSTGHFHAWWEDSILSNFRRVAVPVSIPDLIQAVNLQALRWSPLFLISFAMLAMAGLELIRIGRGGSFTAAARFNVFLALWLLGGCLGVASAKSFYDHYFLQILPVMCISMAWIYLKAAPLIRALPRFGFELLFAAVLALPLVAAGTALSQAAMPIMAVSNGQIMLHQDTPTRIAHEIQPLLTKATATTPAGRIYVFDYQPIIYSLDKQIPPTKYAFPSVLTKCQLAQVAKAPALHEIRRILATNPEFIVRSLYPVTDPSIVNTRVYAAVNRTIAARYQVWRVYDAAVVYRLRDPNARIDRTFDTLNPPAACPVPAR